MTNQQKSIWFKRKAYGWGWTPCCAEGWLTLVLYTGLLAAPSLTGFFDALGTLGYVAYAVILSVLLVALCYYKGEKPRWQWGARPKD